ncbi:MULTISPECIES: 1-phosphofructokinase [unclassified Sporosarcina]|uniref:1-phosphofructokinase n=1 Tax=unclassified Sporosarcina TaxID=2647733 RepID=UPI0030F68962
MILTVTLNPSVDISYKLEDFKLDAVNRVGNISKTAGGKGLNVSRVLVQLEEEVAATGFLGGSLGGFIREQINNLSIGDCFIDIIEETRNCIAVIHNEKQTEILENGPRISKKEAKEFLEQFQSFVNKVDIITISGSLPRGLEANYYGELLKIAHENQSFVLLDTSGEALKYSLEGNYKPFLIKPNQEELEELINRKINTETDTIQALQHPILNGITWVVVTLGGQGALVRYEEKVYRVQIPEVKVINPVGSGDSVIAGFAAGFSRKLPPQEVIKYGIAMGVLNAMQEKTGSIDTELVNRCIGEIKVEMFN